MPQPQNAPCDNTEEQEWCAVPYPLPLAGNRRVTLDDDGTVVLDPYLATVLWATQPGEVLVLAAEGGSLMGIAMLYGHRVILQVADVDKPSPYTSAPVVL